MKNFRKRFGLLPRESALGFELTGSQHFIKKDRGHAFALAAKRKWSNLFARSLREKWKEEEESSRFFEKKRRKKLLSWGHGFWQRLAAMRLAALSTSYEAAIKYA